MFFFDVPTVEVFLISNLPKKGRKDGSLDHLVDSEDGEVLVGRTAMK